LGTRLEGLEVGVNGQKFRAQGFGFRYRVCDSVFSVEGLLFRVRGLGLRVAGLGFRAWGRGFRVPGSGPGFGFRGQSFRV